MSFKTFVIVGLPIIGVLLLALFGIYLFIPTWFNALCPCLDTPRPKTRKEIQIVEVPIMINLPHDTPPLYE